MKTTEGKWPHCGQRKLASAVAGCHRPQASGAKHAGLARFIYTMYIKHYVSIN